MAVKLALQMLFRWPSSLRPNVRLHARVAACRFEEALAFLAVKETPRSAFPPPPSTHELINELLERGHQAASQAASRAVTPGGGAAGGRTPSNAVSGGNATGGNATDGIVPV